MSEQDITVKWDTGEIVEVLPPPPDGHTYRIEGIDFSGPQPRVKYSLVATGIICSPSWVLNQDDDEGEDEHDNEADGLVPCPDCAHTSHPGWYIGLGKRERCDRCSGSEWVGKDEA